MYSIKISWEKIPINQSKKKVGGPMKNDAM